MVEYKLNEEGLLVEVNTNEPFNSEEITLSESALPVERGFWSKFKGFMFKEITFANILPRVNFELELSQYEKKVFKEVKDFWTQDIRDIFNRNKEEF